MDYLWLIYALLSAVMAALVGVFGKVGLQSVDANTATAVRAVIMALFLLVFIAFQGHLKEIPAILADRKAIALIALSGVAGAMSWLFYFVALKYGKVSQVAPVDKLSVVLAAIIAVSFLGEKITVMGGSGIALIAIGAIMIALG